MTTIKYSYKWRIIHMIGMHFIHECPHIQGLEGARIFVESSNSFQQFESKHRPRCSVRDVKCKLLQRMTFYYLGKLHADVPSTLTAKHNYIP